MTKDRAGESYWNNVWGTKQAITPIDIGYYTHRLFHELYQKYLPVDENLSVAEIGCALSAYLPYFHRYFGYQVHGFDYEADAVEKTAAIYKAMGLKAHIRHRDFFSHAPAPAYDLLTSFGVFEHFEDLEGSIAHTKHYLKKRGMILTVIPNMNGLVGFLQKTFNRKVYDVHIPYTAEEIRDAHEKAGYHTLFCDYFGLYQAGVVNLEGVRHEAWLQKALAVPGKPFYHMNRVFGLRLDSKWTSPYIVYIGKLDA